MSERQTNERERKRDRAGRKDDRPTRYVNIVGITSLLISRTRIADDQGDTGAAYPSAGAGEGTRVVQGLLQQVHHVPEGQDAEREPAAQRLQPTWTRHGPVEWEQWEQSVAG